MSDRLEDLNVPPKLLAAIRHEVRSNTEQQLNDLWMVVHSLKNSGAAEPAGDDGLKQELGDLQQKLEGALSRLDAFNSEFDNLKEDLKKRVAKVRKLVEEKGGTSETPQADWPAEWNEVPQKLGQLVERLDKLERDTSQLGGAAALFESRLGDQESRTARRIEEVESRLGRQLANLPAAAPTTASAVDELSTAALMTLEGSVDFSLADYAKVAIKYNASDLVIRPNSLPYTYLEGDLIPMGQKVLTSIDSYRVTMLALQHHERQQLLEKRSFSKLVEFHGVRFLLNAYFERGELSAYARRLTPPPMSLDSLDLPRTLEVSLLEDRGLILLCGSSAGSLKSLAYALMQPINQQRRVRILTYEDAIVYELPEEQSLMSQLQRGVDLPSASHLLRLRPDVLYLQRVETAEDLQIVLDFASDRTLVLAGCSGSGVVSSLQQMLEIAPPERRNSLLAQLGGALKSVLCYRQPQPSEYLINSSKVRPWLERGDFAALQTAVETSVQRPSSSASPGPTLGGGASRPPKSDPPLPHPSSESLSAVPAPTATSKGRASLQPPPSLDPPSTENEVPATAAPPAAVEPPSPSGDSDKSGGDDETLLGWL